jgi:hypothetical protein
VLELFKGYGIWLDFNSFKDYADIYYRADIILVLYKDKIVKVADDFLDFVEDRNILNLGYLRKLER